MRINTNVNAMIATNQMSKNTALSGASMEKLSTGLRITKAADDATGLAISEKMRSQIRGMEQAERNVQDGISMVQTAEGAMEEIGNITQRMRELTVQSSNETNTVDERTKIAEELKQLHTEIDRIAESTQFNGKTLLANKVEGAATVNGSGVTGDIQGLDTFKNIFVDGKDTSLAEIIKGGKIELTLNNANPAAPEYSLKIKDKDGNVVANATDVGVTGNNKLQFELKAGSTTNDFKGHDTQGALNAVTGNLTLNINATELQGNGMLADGGVVSVDIKGKADDLNLDLQVGANTGDSETLNVNITNMSTDSLGLSKADMESITNADLSQGTEASKKLIEKLDTALEKINTNRSNLGAVQNRLETSQSNLTTSTENLTAAESRIRDVDVAKEMVKLSKLNILNQASQAMVSQAKQQPESVSQLLR